MKPCQYQACKKMFLSNYVKIFVAVILFCPCLISCKPGSLWSEDPPAGRSITVKDINWISNDTLGIVSGSDTQRSPIELVSLPSGQKRSLVINGDTVIGYNSSRRGLLFTQFTPGLNDDGLSSNQLMIYDTVLGKAYSLSDPSALVLTVCWSSETEVSYVTTAPAREERKGVETLTLVRKSLEGRVIDKYNLPDDISAFWITYINRGNRLIVQGISTSGTGHLQRSLYSFVDNNLIPIPGSQGAARYFDVNSDRSQIVVATLSERAGRSQFTGVMRVDFSKKSPIIDTILPEADIPSQASITHLQLSPDGKTLLLSLNFQDHPSAVYLFDIASRHLSKVTEGTLAVFSPDGKQIAYAGNSRRQYINNNKVYICDFDGNGIHQVYGVRSASLVTVISILIILIILGITITWLFKRFLKERKIASGQ